MPKTSRAFITIGGFQQRRGLVSLNETLCQIFWDRRKVRLYPRAWDCSPELLADEITEAHAVGADIRAATFSWGTPTFARVASILSRRGYTISRWLILDGVNRIPAWPHIGLPIGRVTVPANVREVVWIHQANEGGLMGLVNGREPHLEDPAATVIKERRSIPRVSHVWIDDHPEFEKAAIAAFTQPVEKATP